MIDAAAAASVAALHGDATPVTAEDQTTVFSLLEERRANLAAQRVRVANQLNAVLRELVPGVAEVAITAKSAAVVLRSVRPASACERTRRELAQDLVRDPRAVDERLADIERRMAAALDDHGSRLREVDGVGAVTAVRLIGRTGPASRFPTADAFATCAGVAQSRSPPGNEAAIASRVAVTANSTRPSTSLQSPRSAWATVVNVATKGASYSPPSHPATEREGALKLLDPAGATRSPAEAGRSRSNRARSLSGASP